MKPEKIEAHVYERIKREHMLHRGDSVLVAVSGGLDSVSLLRILVDLQKRLGISLLVGHVNHCLRGNAKRDAEFVRDLAKKYNLPFITKEIKVKEFAKKNAMSIEEAARVCRYCFFTEYAKTHPKTVVALAHHEDDQAETVLMRLIKGAGLRGLSAIRASMSYDGVKFIRPLLALERANLEAYATVKRLKYSHDETNRSKVFLRNKIRLSLLPVLEKEYNPNIKKTLARIAHIADIENTFLDKRAQEEYKSCAREVQDGVIVYDRAQFVASDPAIAFRMLQHGIDSLQVDVNLQFDHWQRFWHDVRVKKKCSLDIHGLIRLRAQYNEITIASDYKGAPFEHQLDFGQDIVINDYNLRISCEHVLRDDIYLGKDEQTEYFDFDCLSFPLIVRSRKSGDRFRPLGMKGTKKVKDYVMEKKIPHYERHRIILVTSNDAIVWVAPYVIDDRFKITSTTKRVTRLSIHRM